MSETETSYQLAQPAGAVFVQGEEATGVFKNDGGVVVAPAGQKQGHKCCGGCCDVRRAVIVVNLVNIGILGMTALSLLAQKNVANNAETVDDDEVQEVMDLYASMKLGPIVAVMAVQIVISAVGVAGAFLFNYLMVGVTAIAYCLGIVSSLVALSPGSLLYNGFFLYPHIFLIKEIRSGVMTKENYPAEKQSCCCV